MVEAAPGIEDPSEGLAQSDVRSEIRIAILLGGPRRLRATDLLVKVCGEASRGPRLQRDRCALEGVPVALTESTHIFFPPLDSLVSHDLKRSSHEVYAHSVMVSG